MLLILLIAPPFAPPDMANILMHQREAGESGEQTPGKREMALDSGLLGLSPILPYSSLSQRLGFRGRTSLGGLWGEGKDPMFLGRWKPEWGGDHFTEFILISFFFTPFP